MTKVETMPPEKAVSCVKRAMRFFHRFGNESRTQVPKRIVFHRFGKRVLMRTGIAIFIWDGEKTDKRSQKTLGLS